MEVAGSAVGIASLGIQICQGLLDWYDGWQGYLTDIASACESIADLNKTLALLKVSLEEPELDQQRKQRVQECLQSCEDGISKLSKKLQKLQSHGQPKGTRQKIWQGVRRAWYPFRLSTLAKLREIVADIHERLHLALQVLQLDVSSNAQQSLVVVSKDVRATALRTENIETAVGQLSTQTQHLISTQQSEQFGRIKKWLSAPDPWTNHSSARQKHEPHTGLWFLQSKQYMEWKTGLIRHLWVYGKAGCGKTVLS